MIEISNINALFLTQKNILKIIKDSDKMQDSSNTIAVLGSDIRKLLKSYPDILDIYDDLENEVRFLLKEAEANAYYYGFKAGLQIAVEGGLSANS